MIVSWLCAVSLQLDARPSGPVTQLGQLSGQIIESFDVIRSCFARAWCSVGVLRVEYCDCLEGLAALTALKSH